MGRAGNCTGRVLCFTHPRDRRYETIALSRDRLHEPRLIRIITQHQTDLPDEGIDAVLGINEDAIRPQAFSDLRPCHELAILRDKQDQQLHWHPFELHAAARTQELKAFGIQLKLAKLKDAYAHRSATPRRRV
jgi:hypothetical protein